VGDSKQVVMLVSNPYRPDPRVEREARALADCGYRVTVICWDRQAELPEREAYTGVDVVRVHNVRSAYAAGWRQLFYLPRFWREANRLALDLSPDMVHCHDLDTLYAGRLIKKRLGSKLVYDAHEHYPALMSLYLPTALVRALARWESSLMRHVDAVFTASTVLRDEYTARGIRPVVTLGNYADLTVFNSVSEGEAAAVRAQLGLAPDEIFVTYIGGFSRNRLLLPLIEAATLLPTVRFHLWGDGPQRSDVEQAATHQPNVHYHGWLPYEALPGHFRAADIIYYCLRLDYPGAIYNAPNTLSQAMAAGRPVIANDVGDLGRIVTETGCGMLLPTVTPVAISQAIDHLNDPGVRRQLGKAGRASAKAAYNWAACKQELYQVYSWLMQGGEPLHRCYQDTTAQGEL
jgi:glycosyltransferase involved in cell wall biosynthesis